jgi:hypothetical protein
VFNFLKNLFSTKHIGTEKDKIYDWLSSSSSLEEIERRQRMLRQRRSTLASPCQSKSKRMDIMFKKIMHWFEVVGTARAAAELSRQGHYTLARKLMTDLK